MSVALVTGASSGIGSAVAIAFADAGWEVMAAGRDDARLGEVADAGDDIATWAGELIDAGDCDELVADAVDEFGTIDCLVNCAGTWSYGDATETGDEEWRNTMRINLDVPFFLSRAAMPQLFGGGSIVNVACASGLRPGKRAIAYATSKAGLIMLTRSMALDHAADGVRSNAVCPGAVETPMLAAGADSADLGLDEFLEKLASNSPDGRIATPEEVAELVIFLAGDAAAHINGAVIPIDGGLPA